MNGHKWQVETVYAICQSNAMGRGPQEAAATGSRECGRRGERCGTSHRALVGRRVMTTPQASQRLYDKEGDKIHKNTGKGARDMTGPLLQYKTDWNCKLLYLFLSCSEFYLPALVGHTAALVNGPRCYGGFRMPAANSILLAGTRTLSGSRSLLTVQPSQGNVIWLWFGSFWMKGSPKFWMGFLHYQTEWEVSF